MMQIFLCNSDLQDCYFSLPISSNTIWWQIGLRTSQDPRESSFPSAVPGSALWIQRVGSSREG